MVDSIDTTNQSAMAMNLSRKFFNAAQAGATPNLEALLRDGAKVDDRCDGFTALMGAAIAGKHDAVHVLLDNGADVTARDPASRTIIKLALDGGHTELAQTIVHRYPELLVTDPRLPKGAAWLREQFAIAAANVKDPASKPTSALLERLLSGNLGPVEGRGVSDVYWEHIFLRYIGDIPLDIQRNYSTNLVLSLVGTFNVILHGHEGRLPRSLIGICLAC
ncbi:ankyrin repeat domain-containing protein [Ensifer sp. YR511]|uniref:ankyrin repeat domain-containing protein n=1 Tax=Ensifer sp. YR511 TaxID=1855294 RepID=UPI00088AE7ED|nr:ankyrin repeat domain-containing protein [Ensifer sp. YR511]SDN80307.1 Ankyrin repeat-containing protein [Ensifer sp. YR511]